jgi:hypothetical protein
MRERASWPEDVHRLLIFLYARLKNGTYYVIGFTGGRAGGQAAGQAAGRA